MLTREIVDRPGPTGQTESECPSAPTNFPIRTWQPVVRGMTTEDGQPQKPGVLQGGLPSAASSKLKTCLSQHVEAEFIIARPRAYRV